MSFTPTLAEKKKYVLATSRDVYILKKCKELEAKPLSPEDKSFLRFIKSQLEEDWRKPLIKIINTMKKKYSQES